MNDIKLRGMLILLIVLLIKVEGTLSDDSTEDILIDKNEERR